MTLFFVRSGFIVLSSLMVFAKPSVGANSDDLQRIFEAMQHPVLDTASTIEVQSLELNHKDLELIFLTGRMAFFEPVVLGAEEMVYGGYFEGSGRLKFVPRVDIEKEQLNRFFRSDSLDHSFEKMLLLFTPEIHGTILESVSPAEALFSGPERQETRKLVDELTESNCGGYSFELLSNLIHPSQRPFLVMSVEPDNSEPVVYIFNPEHREEVRFLKSHSQPGSRSYETVCRYSQYIDPAYVNINGLNKDRIFIQRYAIDVATDSTKGFTATALVTFEVKMTPTRMIQMNLDPDLVIDSIVDSTGQRVTFSRYGEGAGKQLPIYLFFDRSLSAGEQIDLHFFYHGGIIDYGMGQYFETSGVTWYPRYQHRQRSLFTLNFKTPEKYALVASGNLTSENRAGDTLFTTWKVVPPATDVSFNLGRLKKLSYEVDGVKPVDVYFAANFRQNIGPQSDAEEVLARGVTPDEVADDVINTLRVYDDLFGPYPFRQLTVGEVLQSHGEAVPGFLHVGCDTWTNTSNPDTDHILRAHELAHQWWGVEVGYETYHDRWLCEGLADYSALMYLQVVAGNEIFLDRIREYRTDIYSAREYLYGSGEEFGPIALGNRTAGAEIKSDYNLIVHKKATLVFHMLRNLLVDLRTMREERFKAMLRDFYNSYRGDLVSTQDFRRVVEKHAGIDMGWFFDQFVYGTELPTYEFTYNFDRDSSGTFTARCHVITTGMADDFQMYVPLEIEIDGENKAYVRILINSPDYEFTLPELPRRPRTLRLNPFESVLARVKQ